MQINITEIDANNLHHGNQCHEPFLVDSKLVLSADNGIIHYTIASVTPYEKQYPPNQVDYSDYIQNSNQIVFFAFIAEDIAGELVLRQWWNDFAYIEDIAIKSRFKRQGVGRALVERAISWTKDLQLPGLMLETQNNNVAACRFYKRCGFELGGFDQYLYRALHPESEEIALYWYLLI